MIPFPNNSGDHRGTCTSTGIIVCSDTILCVVSITEQPFGIVKIVTVSSSFGLCVSRYVHLSHFKNTLLTYTHQGKFWREKSRAQEEPKSLRPDSFSGLQICQNCLCGRGSAPDPAGGNNTPPDPLAGLREPTSNGRQGRNGREEEGREGEGRGRQGRESCAPFLKFLDPPPLLPGILPSILLVSVTCNSFNQPKSCQQSTLGDLRCRKKSPVQLLIHRDNYTSSQCVSVYWSRSDYSCRMLLVLDNMAGVLHAALQEISSCHT